MMPSATTFQTPEGGRSVGAGPMSASRRCCGLRGAQFKAVAFVELGLVPVHLKFVHAEFKFSLIHVKQAVVIGWAIVAIMIIRLSRDHVRFGAAATADDISYAAAFITLVIVDMTREDDKSRTR